MIDFKAGIYQLSKILSDHSKNIFYNSRFYKNANVQTYNCIDISTNSTLLRDKHNKKNRYVKNSLPTKIVILLKINILLFFYELHYQKIQKCESYLRWRHLLTVFQNYFPQEYVTSNYHFNRTRYSMSQNVFTEKSNILIFM